MGLLAPREDAFWDIRSRDPRPGLRVIGHFAETDVFVALVWRPRSVVFEGRLPLGEVEGPNGKPPSRNVESNGMPIFQFTRR